MSTTHRRAENVESIAAVTPMQQGILFHALREREQDPYFIQRVFVVNSPVDESALQRAWQAVADRHQVLRADYRWEEAAKPAQVIYKSSPVVIRRQNWRALDAPQQLERLRRKLATERNEGYDFRRASEQRLSLIELADGEFWLVWSYHHIALDGWSAALILSEVLGAYHAGRAALPAAPPYTAYLDFVHGHDPARALEHFRGLLEGAEIPTPLPRLESGREAGYAEHVLRLSRAQSERLRERARTRGITLNTLVHGAWALLLGRCADASEVVFGATVSGRSAELNGIDGMAGLFINTLPCRVRLEAAKSVGDWLADIQTQSLESRRYEHTPLGEIRRAAGVAGDRTLFDSVVVFENYPIDEVLERQPSQLRVQPMAAELLFEQGVRTTGRNNYPLTLNVIPGEQLVLTIAYQRDWFDDRAAAGLGVQLEYMLGALSERVEARLGEIGLLAAGEQRDALGGERGPFVLSAFQRESELRPDAVALQAEERHYTYLELERASNRIARHLIERGVGLEARVGLRVERSIEFVAGVLACWKAGAAYVPLDPKLPAARIDALVQESQAALVLDAAAIAQLARSEHSDAPLRTALHADQAAYLIFTSGSTGRPKAVVVSHGALAGYVNGLAERVELPSGARMAMVSTAAADLGHTVLFGSLCTGGSLHLVSEERAFDPDAFGQYMAAHAIEVLKIVPSHLGALLHAAEPSSVLPSKLLVLGGEASPWSLVARIRTLRPECRVVNHYGPTEATVGASFHPVDAAAPPGRSVPIGRALPGAALEVLDRDLNRVPAGVAGELYIGGARLARGYFAAPGASAARFLPDPYGPSGARMYRTGDRVKRGSDGSLEFLGRVDRQIKVRGYRVELGEIESRLREHPAVGAAVVVPGESAAGALQLTAYVAAGGIDRDVLSGHLRASLPEYMVPAQFVVLAELPLTRNGKLDLQALSAGAADQSPPLAANDETPENDVERALAAVWRDVLRVARVGVEDDFFKLGGDSILSLQVVARARRRGFKVTPQQLFEQRTLRALARVATLLPAKASVPQPRAAKADSSAGQGPIPLLPIQVRFFARDVPEPQRYNQSILLRTRQRLEPKLLERALGRLVEHHDALRFSYRRDRSGRWEQRAGAVREVGLWLCEAAADDVQAIAERAHASLSLEDGPLVRAVLIELPAAEQRLLLVIHHLAVDGVSWRILLEDLQTLYRGGELPAKTSSVAEWAQLLHARATAEVVVNELPYWLEQLRPGAELVPDRAGSNLVKHEARCALRLSKQQSSRLLREAPEHYGCRTQDLLLTALARVLCRRYESEAFGIELESHGREDLFDGVDLSRTVGWFTSVFPLRLVPGRGGRAPLREAVGAVSAQLRSVPHGGLGFGALRYVADEPRLRESMWPSVTFNYLGQFDSSFDAAALFEPAREPEARGQSENAPLANRLAITGQVHEGELRFSFAYSRALFDEQTVEVIVRMYRSELEAILAGVEGGTT